MFRLLNARSIIEPLVIKLRVKLYLGLVLPNSNYSRVRPFTVVQKLGCHGALLGHCSKWAEPVHVTAAIKTSATGGMLVAEVCYD